MRFITLCKLEGNSLLVGQVGNAAVAIDFHYEEGGSGQYIPVVRNLSIQNLKTRKSEYALYLRGFNKAPIEGVSLSNCDFAGVDKPNILENVKNISIRNVRINGREIE